MANRPPGTARAKRGAVQPPAIEARGEKTLKLDGVSYRLRPSRAAISAIEEETGKSLLELVAMANRGGLSLEFTGIVAAQLIRAGADQADDTTRHVGATRIADLIYEDGVMTAQAVLTLVLLNAATGGRTVEGNEKAATA